VCGVEVLAEYRVHEDGSHDGALPFVRVKKDDIVFYIITLVDPCELVPEPYSSTTCLPVNGVTYATVTLESH
jgi:hypothetical protein